MLKFCLLKLIWQIDITKIINLSAILWLFKHLYKRNIENIDAFQKNMSIYKLQKENFYMPNQLFGMKNNI